MSNLCIQKCHFEYELDPLCMMFADERLADFRILIGNEFSQGATEAADIGTWPECVYVSGKYLF